MKGTQLGPFELLRHLGRGGMGTVWSGRHRDSGHRVALKIVRTDRAGGGRAASELRREVRAMAALDHPNVVRVYDHGTDAEGAFWMALDLASGTALEPALTPRTWSEVRELLRAVLDGLGHAHGAGVLHRDVKLDNVLCFPADPDGARWRLTDFGIALRTGERTGAIVGTPRQMSPEQVRGDARTQGPWTDLYGLGCLAWELLTGAPIFAGRAESVLHQQLHAAPPAFVPRLGVPPGLEAWLRTLVAKAPSDRFPTTAHARTVLDALPEVMDQLDEEATTLDRTESLTWHTNIQSAAHSNTVSAPTAVLRGPASWTEQSPALIGQAIPPLSAPASWRGPVRTRDVREMGAGLGLLGIHVPRMVGREVERDQLWELLVGVVQSRRPALVALDGPDGAGRTRLSLWPARRGHELLGASGWRLRPGLGLPGLAADILRCTGASEQEARRRIAAMLRLDPDPWLANAWLALVGPVLDPPSDTAPVGREAAALVGALLARATRHAPAVVTVDQDAGSQTGPLLAEVLSRLPGEVPVLVVLDGDPGGLPAGSHRVEVQPLGPERHLELVRAFAWLAPRLELRLAEHTAGSPGLVRHLLAELVEGGTLLPGADGLHTDPPGAPLPLAGTASPVRQRLERRFHDDTARIRLERAAVLGMEVDRGRLARALDQPVDGLADLEESLLSAGLARPTDRGWAFTSQLVRRAALSMAADAGRLAEHHRACAAVLTGRDPTTLRRRAEHLAGAHLHDQAFDTLIEAMVGGDRQWTSVQRASALEMASRLLDALGAPPDAPRRATLALQQVRHATAMMQQESALEHARFAIAHGVEAVRLEAMHQAALLFARLGRSQEAWGLMEQLEGWRPDVVAFDRGVLLQRQGDTDGAKAALVQAVALTADEATRAKALRQLAHVESQCGQRGDAWAHFRQAARINLEIGQRLDAGMCRAGEASCLAAMERNAEARTALEEAIAILDSVGAPTVAVPLLNLADTLLVLGEVDRAHRAAERARELLQRSGQSPLLAGCHASLIECHVRAARWSSAERELGNLERLLADRPFHHPQLADTLRRSADAARNAGQTPIATDLDVLVASQDAALGR